ncbi:hypothetical protein ABIE56_002223 [Luteibacter sp. 621]|jgi:hypothetical protein|uniref:hypothetical protein n=1 Tax=Luteibacter sp. 621 TaxID=3373916 RepID=UPI003D1F91F1
MSFAVHDALPPSGHAGEFASAGAPGEHASLNARTTRLETGMEYIREDIRNLRLELRDTRIELRTDIRDLRTELRTDFRLLFGSMITFGLGITGMMAKGFHWI